MQASIYITYIEDVSAEVWIKVFEKSVGLSSLTSPFPVLLKMAILLHFLYILCHPVLVVSVCFLWASKNLHPDHIAYWIQGWAYENRSSCLWNNKKLLMELNLGPPEKVLFHLSSMEVLISILINWLKSFLDIQLTCKWLVD